MSEDDGSKTRLTLHSSRLWGPDMVASVSEGPKVTVTEREAGVNTHIKLHRQRLLQEADKDGRVMSRDGKMLRTKQPRRNELNNLPLDQRYRAGMEFGI